MKLFENWTMVLAACFCVLVAGESKAKIAWDKDLVFDANMNSTPLACCTNRDGDGVIVMAVECPRGALPLRGGDSVLWKIGADGKTTRIPLRNAEGDKVWTNAKAIGPGCAMAADRLGNLLTVGVLGEQRKEQSLAVISMAEEMEPNVVARNVTDRFRVGKLIPFQDNTFVLAGARNMNGLCWKIDNQGNVIRQEQLDLGRDESFTGLDWLKSDDPCLAVVGLSVGSADNNTVGMSAENFIVLYDANCKMIRQDDFIGWQSVSAITLVALRPKVCQLDNGNILVVHGKESTDSKRCLWARCYTPTLELMWEKEVFSGEDSPNKLPSYFDLTSCGSKGFAVGVLTPLEGLKFYLFDKDGGKVDYTEYKGMISIPGFNLMRITGRTIAVFEECSGQGRIEEITIKAKVVALD